MQKQEHTDAQDASLADRREKFDYFLELIGDEEKLKKDPAARQAWEEISKAMRTPPLSMTVGGGSLGPVGMAFRRYLEILEEEKAGPLTKLKRKVLHYAAEKVQEHEKKGAGAAPWL